MAEQKDFALRFETRDVVLDIPKATPDPTQAFTIEVEESIRPVLHATIGGQDWMRALGPGAYGGYIVQQWHPEQAQWITPPMPVLPSEDVVKKVLTVLYQQSLAVHLESQKQRVTLN